MYAQICFPFSLNKTFTYKVSSSLVPLINPGTLVKVLFKNKKCSGLVVSTSYKTPFKGKLNSIISIDQDTSIPNELWKTLEWMSHYYVTPIGKVSQIGLSWIFNKQNNQIRRIKHIQLNTQSFTLDYFLKKIDLFTINQKIIINHLINNFPNPVPLINFKAKLNSIYTVYKQLINQNFIIEEFLVFNKKNTIINNKSIQSIQLTTIQKNTYYNIYKNFNNDNKPHFIHGVTSSGKTEIYLKIVNHFFKKNKSCLILVPEIMLSSQIYKRFQEYFGNKVLLWHSQSSKSNKNETWSKINKGGPYIVVGARSAVFVPLKNLGTIIVDEEHDSSYKESEKQPTYNARDVAIVRARFSQSIVILGSATPSLETYYNAITNKYHLYEINQRYGKSILPNVELIHINKSNHFQQIELSTNIINAINYTIKKKEQVLILHNRRGYSSIKVCNNSNEILKCNNCDIILTFHATINSLICHQCSKKYTFDSISNNDNKQNIQYFGCGTEQLEFILNEQFPNYSILRMDADSANSMNKQNKILNQFKKGDYNILLGTQMIAKGLDIKNITLVIVINADLGISIPDFKSHEKIFQLINQVIGRSGRSNKKGTAIIQTADPTNEVLQMATNYESKKFYNLQLESRKSLNYPPFSRLMRIIFQSKSEKKCELYSIKIFNLLKNDFKGFIMDPFPCPIEKTFNYVRYQIIIKIPHQKLKFAIDKLHSLTKNKLFFDSKNIKILIDMDSDSIL